MRKGLIFFVAALLLAWAALWVINQPPVPGGLGQSPQQDTFSQPYDTSPYVSRADASAPAADPATSPSDTPADTIKPPALESHVVRGRMHRRVLDRPNRFKPEPGLAVMRPFGAAEPAPHDSEWAHSPYTRSTLAATWDPAVFYELAEGKHDLIRIPLEQDQQITLRVNEVVVRGPHTVTFVGKAVEEPDSDILLVFNDGVVGGSVSLYGQNDEEGQFYEFGVLEDGRTAIKRMEPSAFLPQECGVCAEPHAPGAHVQQSDMMSDALEEQHDAPENDNGPSESSDDPIEHIVDIVVGYDHEARLAEGGVAAMEARIITSVDRMNLALQNSLVYHTELVLLGVIEDPDYVFPGWTEGTTSDELNALNTHGNGRLDAVSQLRLDLGADLQCFVMKDTDGDAGRAFMPGRSSVVARTYMTPTRITFVHELGHNFGLDHAWGDSSGSVNKHSYGWRFTDGTIRRRTVMAYEWSWERVLYFSHPDIIHPNLNVPVGAPLGYNATGDDTTDERFISGGAGGSYGSGFDGTNPNLGAMSAIYLYSNAHSRAALSTRTDLAVTYPEGGMTLLMDAPSTVEWVGGALTDSATLSLLNDGVHVLYLAEDISNADRAFPWTPSELNVGNNYQIMLSLNNGAQSALSKVFTIAYEADLITISPEATWTSAGQMGGPFTSVEAIYLLSNIGESEIVWSAVSHVDWLTLQSSNGLLAAYQQNVPIEVLINAQAESLLPGVYEGEISFYNHSSGGLQSRHVQLTVTPSLCFSLNACELVWTTGGNANWHPQTSNTQDGVAAAVSGLIFHNQQTWLETTVEGPGELTFWWRVSSEAHYDFLKFFINGIEQNNISGEKAWSQRAYTLEEGTHVLRWKYVKDASIHEGDDRGWVDLVTYEPMPVTDGIPDWWWDLYNIDEANRNADTDGDGDGFRYIDEYIADTNPADPNDRFPDAVVAPAGDGSLTITIDPTSLNRIYQVWWTDDLTGNPQYWNLHPDEQPGTGTAVTFTLDDEPSGRTFRTGVRLP